MSLGKDFWLIAKIVEIIIKALFAVFDQNGDAKIDEQELSSRKE